MKINWKLRLRNKTTLLALLGCMAAFIYQILGILGVTVPISEDQIIQAVGLVINMLTAVGVLVDPTTSGVEDSRQALTYHEPR